MHLKIFSGQIFRFEPILLLFISGYCLLLSSSFFITHIPYGYDQTRFIQVGFLSLLAWASLIKKNDFLAISRSVKSLLLIIFLAGVISSWFAVKPIYAFLEVATFMAIFCASWFLASTLNSQGKIISTLNFYSGFTVLFALMFLCIVLSGYLAGLITGFPLIWYELINGFSNVRFFNQYQIWTLPIITYAALNIDSNKKALRCLVFSILIGWWFLLFLSETRGGLLAILSGALFATIIFKKYVYQILKVNFLAAVSGWLFYKFLFFIVPVYFAKGRALEMIVQVGFIDRVGGLTRMDMWQDCINYIIDNPWFGVGPMHLAYKPNSIAAHPHSSILQWAAEWGLVSFFAVIIAVLIAGYYWCVKFNHATMENYTNNLQNIVMCLFLAISSSLAYSLLDGVFVTPVSQICFLITFGLMWGVYANTVTPVCTESSKIAFLYKIIFISSIITIWYAIGSTSLMMINNPISALEGIQTHGPRYWQIGGIPHH